MTLVEKGQGQEPVCNTYREPWCTVRGQSGEDVASWPKSGSRLTKRSVGRKHRWRRCWWKRVRALREAGREGPRAEDQTLGPLT